MSVFSFTSSVTQDISQAGLYETWASDLLFQVKVENRYLRLVQLEGKGARAGSRESKLSLSLSQMQGALMFLTMDLDLDGLVFAGELAPGNYYPVNNSLSIKTLKVKETIVTE